MIPWIFGGAGILFMVCLLGTLFFAFSLAYPHPLNWWKYSRRHPSGGQAVSLPKGKTGSIPGQWYPCQNFKIPNPGVILLCHGRSRGKGFVEPLALALAHSFSVLTFDFRNHGERGYGPCSMGLKESEDVDAALEYLRGRGHNPIGIVGISMGAAAASFCLSRGTPAGEVQALALVSPYASVSLLMKIQRKALRMPVFIKNAILKIASGFCGEDLSQIDLTKFLGQVKIPMSLFWGSRDHLTGKVHADRLKNFLSFSRVGSYDGGHDEPWNSELQKMLLGWLEESLGDKGTGGQGDKGKI